MCICIFELLVNHQCLHLSIRRQRQMCIRDRYYEQLTQEETEVLWKDVKEVEGLIHKMLDE